MNLSPPIPQPGPAPLRKTQLVLYPQNSPSQGKDTFGAGKEQNPPKHSGPMHHHWKNLHQLAAAEVNQILVALPQPLQDRAGAIAVTFTLKPDAAQIAAGIESDTLGLFTGAAFEDENHSASPIPPQIFLFLENLWAFAAGDEPAFRHEVRTTYLHELGHYLGLEEDDLENRGLD